jgi:teichuronic acid biosynthesis glycosyltransferase TuaG
MIKKNRKFSIVMPAFNAANTIKESVISVKLQDYDDWELIVVDDNSHDNTAAIISAEAILDNRIKLIKLRKNSGVAKARNHALEIATGKYIAFLDSDDTWTRNKLSLQHSAFNNGAKIVFGSYRRTFSDNTYQIVRARPNIDEHIFKYYNPIGNLTGAYDRSVGIVQQENIRHEDYLMWYELVRRSKNAVGLPEILGNYRVSSNSLSGNKFQAAKWHWDVLRNGMNIPVAQASICCMGYALNTVSIRIARRRKITNTITVR